MTKLNTSTIVPGLTLTFNFKYDNGTQKTITVKEGQLVKNLVYLVDQKEKILTGLVKTINFTSKARPDTEFKCKHDIVNVFHKYVTPVSIVFDCSEKYNYKVIELPVDSIVSIEEVEDILIEQPENN